MRHLATAAFILSVAGAGCGKGTSSTTDSDTTPASTSTGTTTTVISGDGFTIALSDPPAESRALLVKVLDVTADQAVRAEVMIHDSGAYQRDASPPDSGVEFTAPVIGFRYGNTFTVEVELFTLADDAPFGSGVFDVDPGDAPELFPEARLEGSWPGGEGGDTLLPTRNPRIVGDDRTTFVLLVDEEGQIIWALQSDEMVRDARLKPDGTMIVIEQNDLVVTDWIDGNRATLTPEPDILGFHHEVHERPEGGYFILGSKSESVPDFPYSEGTACDPGATAQVVDNLLIELDDAGNELSRLAMTSILDTHHTSVDSFSQVGSFGHDWVHLNGHDYTAGNDMMVLSARHQDALIFLERSTNEVKHILGNPDGWGIDFLPLMLTADGPLDWNYHQHGPEMEWDASTNKTTVRMFDNGNVQDTLCGPPSGLLIDSRVVEFEVDHALGTVKQNWMYQYGPPLFSSKMGDADVLDSGHVAGVWGSTTRDGDGVLWSDQGYGDDAAIVVEFDPDTGETLWAIVVYEAQPSATLNGWHVSHAQRLHSLWGQ
jgi:hypothetical protein